MKLFLFIISISLLALADYNTGDNKVVVGTGESVDAVIKFNNGTNHAIKSNAASSKLEITHDGVNYKTLGEGSGSGGGGENYNNAFTSDNNPNAESVTAGWTASAGDFYTTKQVSAWLTSTAYAVDDKVVYNGAIYKANTLHTSTDFTSEAASWDFVTNADALEGDQSFVWTPAAQSDTNCSEVFSFKKDVFFGQSCQASIQYIGGDENLALHVINGDDEILNPYFANPNNDNRSLKAHSVTNPESVSFRCPTELEVAADADKGNIKLCLVNTGATASAPIKWDKSYVGTLVGSSETTLPDILSFHVHSDGTVIAPEVNNTGVTVSRSSTGSYVVDYSALGLTERPTVTLSQVGGNFSGSKINGTQSTTSVTIQTYNSTGGTSDALSDHAFSFTIIKVGKDAKQTARVYKSVPKVSENSNNFVASIDASCNVLSENYDFIEGNCVSNGTGDCTCTLKTGLFSAAPFFDSCNPDEGSSAESHVCEDVSNSATSFRYTVEATNAGAHVRKNVPVTVSFTRASSDTKMPVEQPIIAGQVENSYSRNSSKQVVLESCEVSNPGTPVTDNQICNSWIDSIVDNGTGNNKLNFVNGIFSSKPSCTCTAAGAGICGINTGAQFDETTVSVSTYSSAGASLDARFFITCLGVR